MKKLLTLAGIIVASVSTFGQSPATTSAAECTKNVSFAVTAGGQPVAAIPGFVGHTIGSEKRQQRYSGLCFTQSPDPRYKNYVVVFSTQQDGFDGLVPSVLKYVNSAPIPENSTLGAVYGEMWHYTSSQPATANATTLNLLHTDTSTALFVRAYNEKGVAVSQFSLKDISGWLHTKEKLLDRVLDGIRADSRQVTASPVPVQASLPVYYVNCDVPVKDLAGQTAPLASSPMSAVPKAPASTAVPVPIVPLATLDFSSKPTGADVYVDDQLVGKTPLSLSIAPGEHTVTMRKPNFSSWQRKLQLAEGKHRVNGYLDQKVLFIGSALP